MIDQSTLQVRVPYSSAVAEALHTLPVLIAIVDEHQQVVFGKQELLDFVGLRPHKTQFEGPGDILRCVHAIEASRGCGSSEACELCGAFRAITQSQQTQSTATHDCRIQLQLERGVEDLDLTVTAVPYDHVGKQYTLLTIIDSSNEKRRRALERLFFHDVLNTAGGLAGLTRLLRETKDPLGQAEMLTVLESSTRTLLDEIESQRQLSLAESGDLSVTISRENSLDILDRVVGLVGFHSVAAERDLRVAREAHDFAFQTDAVLLRRVLVNLAKNAVEASEPGDVVTLSCKTKDGQALFSVHNEGYIHPEVQMQLFQRSFSTKGDGRGIGSYSVRMMTERYLAGQVDFTSTKDAGTTFVVALPQQ
ncbi:MAG: sensor histidine kinase [Spirochaetota bacterium]